MAKNVWARYDRTALEAATQYWWEAAQDRAREIDGAVKDIGQLEVALEKAQSSAIAWKECAERLCAYKWKERALAAEACVAHTRRTVDQLDRKLEASEQRAKELEQLLAETEARAERAERALEDADLKSAGLLSSDII